MKVVHPPKEKGQVLLAALRCKARAPVKGPAAAAAAAGGTAGAIAAAGAVSTASRCSGAASCPPWGSSWRTPSTAIHGRPAHWAGAVGCRAAAALPPPQAAGMEAVLAGQGGDSARGDGGGKVIQADGAHAAQREGGVVWGVGVSGVLCVHTSCRPSVPCPLLTTCGRPGAWRPLAQLSLLQPAPAAQRAGGRLPWRALLSALPPCAPGPPCRQRSPQMPAAWSPAQ